jgi:ABC-2 type transport system permease protein
LTTAIRDVPAHASSAPPTERVVAPSKVFFALLRRDVTVARKELPFFLVRTTVQPLLFIIVFGALLPKMGFVGASYRAALLPGILAISLTMSAIQAVALPMMQDFGWTKEIEDRLLAPVPTRVVAAEKIAAAVIQALIAAIVVLPVARIVMGPIPNLTFANGWAIVLISLLGATAFSSLGMWLGTAISPQQIGLMFSVIVAPMIFFGCAYYPWRGLDKVPVVKYLVLLNPLVYVAEGLRGVMTPDTPHMSLGVVIIALVLLAGAGWKLGMRSFYKRAIG